MTLILFAPNFLIRAFSLEREMGTQSGFKRHVYVKSLDFPSFVNVYRRLLSYVVRKKRILFAMTLIIIDFFFNINYTLFRALQTFH